MFLLNQAVRLGVIGGDFDVVHAILLGKVARCSKEGRAIVHDNLFNTSPSTKDLIENEGAKSIFCLSTEGSPFWPGGKGAVGLNQLAELVKCRHKHSVDVDSVEESGNIRDDRGNVELVELSGLTGVTSRDEPLDIIFQHGPPKVIVKVRDGREESLMADCILSL